MPSNIFSSGIRQKIGKITVVVIGSIWLPMALYFALIYDWRAYEIGHSLIDPFTVIEWVAYATVLCILGMAISVQRGWLDVEY